MTDFPPTPVVRRSSSSSTLTLRPYTRFIAECLASPPKSTYDDQRSNEERDQLTPTYADAFSHRRLQVPTSFTPEPSEADASFSFPHSFTAPRKTHSFPPIATRQLESIEESDPEELSKPSEDDASSYSPTFSETSTVRAVLSSSTAPRWTSNHRMTIIKERTMEDDEDEEYPPISSSPGRSSSPLFPHHDSSSSPQTSPDAHARDSEASLTENNNAYSDARSGEDFGSKLTRLLEFVAHQREQNLNTNGAPATRSLPVTPDYIVSPTPPCLSHKNFGPRSYSSSSSSSDSAAAVSCQCSDCHTSEASTRSESLASHSSYTGYAAGIDSSPNARAHVASSARSRAHSTTPTQRLITAKRSYSLLREDPSPSNNYKKLKPNSSLSFHSSRLTKRVPSVKTKLSEVPASLRKSLSLRSDAAQSKDAPTALNTPEHQTNTGRFITDCRTPAIPFDVPIIAPPPEHVARLPQTSETAAKVRIAHLLVREARHRSADKLVGFVSVDTSPRGAYMEVDEQGKREMERLEWELALGVGPELRVEIIEWLLEVLPKRSYYTPDKKNSRTSSMDSSCSAYSSSGYNYETPDLIDQLLTSPETRFHAAYMFVRYFYLLMGDNKERQRIENMQASAAAAENKMLYDTSIPPEGWTLVVWDCCLACLAISVKMHRDVLDPLEPVHSEEYEALAPHELGYDDLETAQRDVLATLLYSLGGTPQPIMDELWAALPSLRQLLDFRDGWKHTQKEAWCRLFDSVTEPDVLKFPVSVLTVTALTEALLAALVFKYKYDSSVNGLIIRRRGRKSQLEASTRTEQKLMNRAEREVEGVVHDIQAVMGIPDEALEGCRRWVRTASKC